MRRRLPLLLVPVVVVVTAACSGSSEDPPTISEQVAAAVAKQLEVPAKDVTAKCPDDTKPAKDVAFVCDLDIDGQAVQAGVAFTSEKEFGFELAAQILHKKALEDNVRDELAQRFDGIDVATVNCGGHEVVVVAEGNTVECHAQDVTGAKAIATVGLDAEGKPTIQSVRNPPAA